MKKKIKFCVNARFLTQKITGVQRYALEISRALKKLNEEIVFISPNNIIHKELSIELGVKKFGFLTGHLWEQVELPIFLKSTGNPLLINLSGLSPMFYGNKILSIYDLSFIERPEWFSKKYHLFYKYFLPLAVRSARIILTASNFSKGKINKILNVDNEMISVIHGAANFLNLEIDPPPCETEYILTAASMDPRKNLHNLILAFNKISNKNIKLYIVGGSASNIFSNNNVTYLENENRNILFLGYVSDDKLKELMFNAKLFVYPSLYEGFGLPPLEAMGCYCPCVLSDIDVFREVYGDSVVYVDPLIIDSIKGGIEKVLNDEHLRKDLIQKGLKLINNYSWDKAAYKLNKLIIGVNNESPSTR